MISYSSFSSSSVLLFCSLSITSVFVCQSLFFYNHHISKIYIFAYSFLLFCRFFSRINKKRYRNCCLLTRLSIVMNSLWMKRTKKKRRKNIRANVSLFIDNKQRQTIRIVSYYIVGHFSLEVFVMIHNYFNSIYPFFLCTKAFHFDSQRYLRQKHFPQNLRQMRRVAQLPKRWSDVLAGFPC